MRQRPPPPPRPARRAAASSRASRNAGLLLLAFLAGLVVALTTYKSHLVLQQAGDAGSAHAAAAIGRRGGGRQQQPAPEAQRVPDVIPCGSSVPVSLGFDYPELRRTRVLVSQLCEARERWSHQQPAAEGQREEAAWQQAAAAAYARALAGLEDPQQQQYASSSSSSTPTTNGDALQQLLHKAQRLLLAQRHVLLRCRSDDSLSAAWQATHHGSRNSTTEAPRSYLLLANFHNSASVLPAFVVQALRLALMLPPPHRLAVGVYESGSSDTSRVWLSLLHQLLLPLGVAHNITLAGALSPRSRLPRIELLAALRNAALDPWVAAPAAGPAAAGAGAREQPQQPGAQTAGAAGAAELTFRPRAPASTAAAAAAPPPPDTIIAANDVFWCAEDAARLVLHRADLACGMDFYSAPWMTQQQHPGSSGGGSGGGGEDEDDFFEPRSAGADLAHQQQQQQGGAGTATSSSSSSVSSVVRPAPAGGALRFYDKWVSRDAAGRRLVNRPPFVVHHAPSSAALAAGQPVAMACCWNGLAALAGGPFVAAAAGQQRLRFRSSRPGECAASECSLLCSDLAAAGRSHVVMDPGVRLAYEAEQVDALQGAGALLGGDGGGGGDAAAAAATPSGGLMPARLPWRDVAAASAALAADAAARARAAAECVAGHSAAACRGALLAETVECCDLRPGASYVDFRRDCRLVEAAGPVARAGAAAG